MPRFFITMHQRSNSRKSGLVRPRPKKNILVLQLSSVKGLSQYVDDAMMILDGSQASLEISFALLESFGQLSGLRVNCEKTEVLWIGSKKGSNQIICPEKNLKWADGKVQAFRVLFCKEPNKGMKRNYEDKVHKVEGILNNWQYKRLTLPGKITVIKTLAAS